MTEVKHMSTLKFLWIWERYQIYSFLPAWIKVLFSLSKSYPHLPGHSAMVPRVEQVGQALDMTWKTRISGSTYRNKTKYVNWVNMQKSNRTKADSTEWLQGTLPAVKSSCKIYTAHLCWTWDRVAAVELCLPLVQVVTSHWLSGTGHCALSLFFLEVMSLSLQFTFMALVTWGQQW